MNCFLFFILLLGFTGYENEDDLYIREVSSHPEKIIKWGKFDSGQIYLQGNTISAEILQFNNRKDMNSFLFCVVKNRNDSIQIYTARDIDGYSIGDVHYRKHKSGDACFFIRLKASGKALLYERKAIPSNDRFLYYLKLPKYRDFFIISPVRDKIDMICVPTKDAGSWSQTFLYSKPTNQNEIFKLFIKTYMNDCKELNGLVTSDYFTIFDLPDIINKYNNCTD
jgi:hypothetical protein